MKNSKNLLKPSDFMDVYPWDSIKQKAESEALACSIMRTRHFKGNNWAGPNNPNDICYKDYLDYKKSINIDNCATSEEFYEINKWCKFPDTAALFSKTWANIIDKAD